MNVTTSQQAVKKIYQSVIDDVVSNIRESFLDEGIDEQILQELRMIWESKLAAQKAIDLSSDHGAHTQSATDNGQSGSAHSGGQNNVPSRQSVAPPSQQQPSNSMSAQPHPSQIIRGDSSLVPIQITVPRLPTDPPNTQRTMSIQVPAFCIQSNKLQEILSLPEIQSVLALPLPQAAVELQNYINLVLKNDQQQQQHQFHNPSGSHLRQVTNLNNILQTDGQTGADDTSDDEEEEEDDDDDLDDDLDLDKDDEKEEEEDVGQDEEPLNSGDDVSDAEDSNDKLYEVDNVVVCQYDKITRTRNKWKFHLKDGIMNLNGKDFIFQKANGDAEW